MTRYDYTRPNNGQERGPNVPLVKPRRDNVYDLNAIRRHAARTSQHTPTRRTSQPQRKPANRNLKNSAKTSRGHKYSANPSWLENIINSIKEKGKTAIKYTIPTLAAVALLGTGATVGSVVSHYQTTQAIESAQETMNSYSPTELLRETENLISSTAKQEYAKQFPHDADTFRNGTLVSITPIVSSAPPEDKTTIVLHYSCYNPDVIGQTETRPMNVKLPTDFVNNVCTPYFNLRDTIESIPEGDLDKVSSWLKLDGPVQELTEGLQTYSETSKDQSYAKDAKQVLEDSTPNRNADGDER